MVKVPLDKDADAHLQRFDLFPRYPPPLDMSMRREAASERLITRGSFIVGLAFLFAALTLCQHRASRLFERGAHHPDDGLGAVFRIAFDDA